MVRRTDVYLPRPSSTEPPAPSRPRCASEHNTVDAHSVTLRTSPISSEATPSKSAAVCRAASFSPAGSTLKNRMGLASARSRTRRCASETTRGTAPNEPWLRWVTDGSRSNASSIGSVWQVAGDNRMTSRDEGCSVTGLPPPLRGPRVPASTPPSTPVSDAPPELTTEREHLTASRAALARMRARTSSLDSSAAGDWVSQQILESAIYRRMKALADDPTVPLFFGRLDYTDAHEDARGERFYIGRRHVSDEFGDPMVVDWRARISRAFYRASKADAMGVEVRRRFGFQHGEMTAYEDEALLEGVVEEHSSILEAEIERPRVGPMRDIVATIQPEQDLIVRSDLDESVCVQGAPGTGKTAVGLHRAAYLLYAHRDQLSRQGVLVVGPNASFLRYIGDVLPALGEIDARQTTIEELAATTLSRLNPKYAIRGIDDPAVATLKGDARLATVARRALWSQVQVPEEGLVVPRGARRWRLAPYEVEEIVAELRARGVRYGAARGLLAQRLAHGILVKMETDGDSPDDRVQDAVARSREVRRYVDRVWPAVDPARLVLRLLGGAALLRLPDAPDFLARAADGVLTAEEQSMVRWRRPAKAPTSARWSLAAAVLIDEV